MLSPDAYRELKKLVYRCMQSDRAVLDNLRSEIRPLRRNVKRIQPRNTTSISLVGTDGGNNRMIFDPYHVHLIRVVDSSNNQYFLQPVTPTTDIAGLNARQFDASTGQPVTALGEMMDCLGVSSLETLSPMIRAHQPGEPIGPTWIQVLRELVEWAVLLSLVRSKEFGTDTLIVYDGLLRSKVFSGDLFRRYRQRLNDAIRHQRTVKNRRIYIAGLAKHNKVIERYRLAMMLEGILRCDYAAYLEIPRDIEEKAYIWSEYARGDDPGTDSITEVNKFVAGKMFLVKFGSRPGDPIWPVDILIEQSSEAQSVLGHLLSDSLNGFPVPFYPLCLQIAHEMATLKDFDFEVFQDTVFDGIRESLGDEAPVIDTLRLQRGMDRR